MKEIGHRLFEIQSVLKGHVQIPEEEKNTNLKVKGTDR